MRSSAPKSDCRFAVGFRRSRHVFSTCQGHPDWWNCFTTSGPGGNALRLRSRMRRTSSGQRSSTVIAKARNRISNIAFALRSQTHALLALKVQSNQPLTVAAPRAAPRPPISPFAVLAKKSLVRNCSGKPRSSAQRVVKRHFRVRVLSPQPRSQVSASVNICLRRLNRLGSQRWPARDETCHTHSDHGCARRAPAHR